MILWIKETRPQFLILSIVLAFLGTAIAWLYVPVNIWHAILAGFGLMLTHGSVNAINDYFDYRSGIDKNTKRTPFSGGSGLVPEGRLPLSQALGVGVVTSLMGFVIGIYFIIVKGWMLAPLIIVAGLIIVLYTPVILRTPWPEWSPGVGLGIMPLLGFYFVQAGRYDWIVLVASVPSGILVHNLLLLNEFPDVEADRNGGRRNTTVAFGLETAGKLFRTATLLVYVWIIACVLLTIITGEVIMPVYCLLAFLALPFALKAVQGSREPENMEKLVPALGANVQFILLAQILIGIGYVLEKIFPIFQVK